MKQPGSNSPRAPTVDRERPQPRPRIFPSAPANDTSADDHALVALLDDLAVLFAELHLQGRLEEISDSASK